MAEINTIIDDSIFKNITNNITDEQFVLIENGDFKFLPSTVLTDRTYGEISLSDNTTLLSLVGGDLALNASYNDLFSLPWSGIGSNISTNTTGLLGIEQSGEYFVSLWATVNVTDVSQNVNLSFRYSIDGTNTSLSTRSAKVTSDFNGDLMNISASGIVEGLALTDSISLFVAANLDCNLLISSAGVSVRKI